MVCCSRQIYQKCIDFISAWLNKSQSSSTSCLLCMCISFHKCVCVSIILCVPVCARVSEEGVLYIHIYPPGTNKKACLKSDGYIALLVIGLHGWHSYRQQISWSCSRGIIQSHRTEPGHKVDERERDCLWVELSKGPLEKKIWIYIFCLISPLLSSHPSSPAGMCRPSPSTWHSHCNM